MSKQVNEFDRIAKIIAHRSGASRREAEKLIAARRVRVDGKIVDSPAIKLAYNANIAVDNLPLKPIGASKLFIFNKPSKVLCSKGDDLGRKTIYDVLPPEYQDLKYIGRLDFMSEGLLLMTNDGELARNLTLPSNEIERVYKVRLYGYFDEERLRSRLAKKITIDGTNYNVKHFSVIEKSGANHWVKVTLMEGKNREIRRIFDHFDLKVSRLIRSEYGPYSLGTLKNGNIKEVKIRSQHSEQPK